MAGKKVGDEAVFQPAQDARTCPVCGKPLPPGRRFCSRKCYGRAYYLKRRERGVCVKCGRPAEGKQLCPACASKDAASRMRRETRLKEKGLCVTCGGPAAPGHMRCAGCLEKQAAATRRLRGAREKAGRCADCKKPVPHGQRRCADCLKKRRLYKRRSAAARRNSGLCIVCGRPVERRPDGTAPGLCRKHDDKMREHRSRRYWRLRSQGLCVTCRRPVKNDGNGRPAFARCEECRRKESGRRSQKREGL